MTIYLTQKLIRNKLFKTIDINRFLLLKIKIKTEKLLSKESP